MFNFRAKLLQKVAAFRDIILDRGLPHWRRVKSGQLIQVFPGDTPPKIISNEAAGRFESDKLKMGITSLALVMNGNDVIAATCVTPLGWVDFIVGDENAGFEHIRQKRTFLRGKWAQMFPLEANPFPTAADTISHIPEVLARGMFNKREAGGTSSFTLGDWKVILTAQQPASIVTAYNHTTTDALKKIGEKN